MKFIRLRPAGVQVPRVTFVNSDHHIITIQGAIHVGSSEFYKKVEKLIEDFYGEVHFEGVRPAEDNKNSLQVKAMSHTYSLLANTAALSEQKEFFDQEFIRENPEKYKNYDVDASILDEFLSSKDFQNLIESSVKMHSKFNITDRAKYVLRSPLLAFILSAASKSKNSVIDKKIILDMRNEFAIKKALETEKDVFMFWGAAHLEGMNKLLTDAGYIVANTQWDTVIPTFKREDKGINRDIEIAVSKASVANLVNSPEWASILWK